MLSKHCYYLFTCAVATKTVMMCVTLCWCRLQPIQNNMLLALNHEYIELSDAATIFLRPADEIAVIPPLSGG